MIKDFHKTAIVTPDKEVSYAELKRYINAYAKVTPCEPGSKVVIFGENCAEWVYAFFSVWQNGGIAVPVDASCTAEDLAYILRDCQPEAIWFSDANEKVAREAIKEACGTSGDAEGAVAGDAEGAVAGIKVLRMQDPSILESSTPSTGSGTDGTSGNTEGTVAGNTEGTVAGDTEGTVTGNAEGTVAGTVEWDVDRERCAVIIYTSGTTGDPKGVMLSYDNLFANIKGVAYEVPIYSSERRAMMLLPVHHVLPLMGTVIAPILVGGGIAICPSMTGADIMATLRRGKVGIFLGVPRLWQVLYGGIMKKINERAVTRGLFRLCKAVNSRRLSRLVFGSIHRMMGGHLDFCVSGGASLDKEIGEGLRALGLDMLEGYGMTETAPVIAFTRPGDYIPGCVGLPLPSVECKLVDGELCAKGPNVMMGYYNRPEETAVVIDEDGYIHTGDLAVFDARGRITITGRKKEIIVLSNGKNVQPSEIEYKLEQYDMVKEAAVIQDGDMLRAIIVPKELREIPKEQWQEIAKELREIPKEQWQEILKVGVIQPYNRTVENYKKIMSIFVYHGELPRTKLDKLQRYKLEGLMTGMSGETEKAGMSGESEEMASFSEEYRIIRDYIEGEKKVDVHPTDHIETDLAFDSLDKVGLQEFMEQTFGVSVSVDAMAEYRNIAAMAEYVAGNCTKVEVEQVDWHRLLTKESSYLKLPVAGLSHRLYAKAFRAFFGAYNGLTVKGLENVPRTGPFIMAPNHQSYLDGAIVMCDMPWGIINHCYFYATEEHVNGRVRRFLASRHNVIIMEQRNLRDSILKMAEVLKQGKSIVIFPEGTRTWNGSLSPFKKTFAILSKELNVPILPVCIKGAFEALPRSTHFLKPRHITVEYLPAIMPDGMGYEELSEKVKTALHHCSENMVTLSEG